MMKTTDRVKIINEQILSDHWSILKETTFDFLRSDGTWQRSVRESYNNGNGAVILLYNLQQETIILIRQFRYPVFASGHEGLLIEAPAGLLDNASPEERIKAETEEETGYRINNVKKIFEAFMSPGSVWEKLHFFIAEYDSSEKISQGGGLKEEGEDIEVFELPFKQALKMIESNEIADGKTIILIQYAALNLFKTIK